MPLITRSHRHRAGENLRGRSVPVRQPDEPGERVEADNPTQHVVRLVQLAQGEKQRQTPAPEGAELHHRAGQTEDALVQPVRDQDVGESLPPQIQRQVLGQVWSGDRAASSSVSTAARARSSAPDPYGRVGRSSAAAGSGSEGGGTGTSSDVAVWEATPGRSGGAGYRQRRCSSALFGAGGQSSGSSRSLRKNSTTIGTVRITEPAISTVVGTSMLPASWERPRETVHLGRGSRPGTAARRGTRSTRS